jgi:hypothetical protein
MTDIGGNLARPVDSAPRRFTGAYQGGGCGWDTEYCGPPVRTRVQMLQVHGGHTWHGLVVAGHHQGVDILWDENDKVGRVGDDYFDRIKPEALELAPEGSTEAGYLTVVAAVGPCACGVGKRCQEQIDHDTPTDEICQVCAIVDQEWPCPWWDADLGNYPPVPPAEVLLAYLRRSVAADWGSSR